MTRRDHALVLGGGIAGLLVARVLADAYSEVTLLDRDDLSAAGDRPRRGVPQARHGHALLARGLSALEALLPGVTAALVAGGAPTGDVLGDTRYHLSGHRFARTEAGLEVVSVTRGFLERHVRDRVLALPAVTVGDPCDVVGLVAGDGGRRVGGVRRVRRAAGSAEETVAADLVVDATGRGSRTPTWLEGLGHRPPPQERVPVDVGYASRLYRLPPDALGGDLAIVHGPAPASPRGGALTRVEGDRLLLTLAGVGGDHPPTDPDGFLAFARSLPSGDIAAAVRDAEPLHAPVPARFPAAVRRRYDRVPPPDGLLVLGDAACWLNPIYAQGMTIAALQALALRVHLAHDRDPVPRRVQRAAARITAGPWEVTVGGDLALPGVDGQPSVRQRLLGAYVRGVHAAAADDADVARAFVRVAGLVDGPPALLRPSVAGRVARHRPGRGGGSAADPSSRGAAGAGEARR